jgi:hypothetical protein
MKEKFVKGFCGKSQGKRTFRRHISRWNNINMWSKKHNDRTQFGFIWLRMWKRWSVLKNNNEAFKHSVIS